jgi:replication factor A1
MRFKDTDLVQLQCEDTSDVPEIKFDFKPLDQLDGVEPKQTCDIITVVEEVGELTSIITKAQQKPFAKRELTLVDQTAMSVRLTLWGKTAETYGTSSGQVGCGEDDKPVIAFKGVSVSDFGGRSLSMFSSATMTVNPDIPEAHSLRGWYDTEGMALAQNKSFKTYASAGMGGVGAGAGGDFVANIKERRTIAQARLL